MTMRKVFFALAFVLFSVPAFAQGRSDIPAFLTPVSAENVCMVNNTAFDTPQIPVEVDGKIYYGCCPMCKERLANDISVRTAIDPVSGKEVDKANAVIGKSIDGAVYYFESQKNMTQYHP